ncbi:hypothetical protein D3P07_11575 [Paenibacillus sp. 1011MAR3C5]|uniref:hypothetical protein n=1 Tax=Paenibacillus sp. 1011MAR3C5 TaxID=1675787 RepID=UPI000E6C1306|nr:hypothetical protein [Paenibacillus sp. 1011MAR3C5]RJE88626.1 hypothetical protein D3P07_11575 [Paenibacillus sp. 1011MAR3C5]
MSKNDVVMIELDRPRELRYGHKAIKRLLAMTGKDIENLSTEDLDLEDLEKYLYCGLLSDARDNNETLTLEQMEDLLDQAPSFAELIEKMNHALESAFGEMVEGNEPVGKQPKTKASPGKSR